MDVSRTPSLQLARRVAAVLALATAAGLAGCREANDYVAPPPPEVKVAAPLSRTITTYKEFTGTAQGFETVELRARVEGFLQEVHFEPGEVVEEGQLLFTIDPRPLKAKVEAARAEVASAEAQLASADAEYRRAVQLYQREVYAEIDMIKLKAARDAAQAAIGVARATLDQAELDLAYTSVTAPISGQISRNLVDVGNLVGNGQATLLATIVQFDPIRAYFTVNESDVLRFREMRRQGQRPDFRKQSIPMGLSLADESKFPHVGTLEYADPQLDPETGTLTARAVFKNPDGVIVPGAFVRLRIPFEVSREVLLVPERSLGSDQAGRYVLVVDAEGKVDQRPVEPGSRLEDLVVIEKGLKPDDQVVISGLQRARPGATVKAIPGEMPEPPAEALAPPGEAVASAPPEADQVARADGPITITPPPAPDAGR